MNEGKDVAVGISAVVLGKTLEAHGLTPLRRFFGGALHVAGCLYLVKKSIDFIFNRNKETSR